MIDAARDCHCLAWAQHALVAANTATNRALQHLDPFLLFHVDVIGGRWTGSASEVLESEEFTARVMRRNEDNDLVTRGWVLNRAFRHRKLPQAALDKATTYSVPRPAG